MRRRGTALFVAAIVLVVCVAAVAIGADELRALIDDVVYDNRNHYLPCEQLPSTAEVTRVMEEHQDAVDAIGRVNPGRVRQTTSGHAVGAV